MTVMQTQPQPLDMPRPDPAKIAIKIALFDESDRADTQRNVPLSHFLDELCNPSVVTHP